VKKAKKVTVKIKIMKACCSHFVICATAESGSVREIVFCFSIMSSWFCPHHRHHIISAGKAKNHEADPAMTTFSTPCPHPLPPLTHTLFFLSLILLSIIINNQCNILSQFCHS